MKLDWIISLISALGGAKGVLLLVTAIGGSSLGVWQGVSNYFKDTHIKNMENQVTELAVLVSQNPVIDKPIPQVIHKVKDCDCQGLIDKYAKEHKKDDH